MSHTQGHGEMVICGAHGGNLDAPMKHNCRDRA